ncbi:MAG: restriction endonuclease [Clostridia bacterium]|nr:restriction endonuclease [Clostridia bacterium]
MKNEKNVYVKIIDILESSPRTRRALIGAYIDTLGLTREQLADKSTKSVANIRRSMIGSVIDEMYRRGMIIKSHDGIYSAVDQKPVVIRKEQCEGQILKLLSVKTMTKSELRRELQRSFGTDKTVTERDDNKLFSYMGDTLRTMLREGVIVQNEKEYSLAGKIAARIDDINSMLDLKLSYLSRLHSRGGEFFETYFMTLLEKYVKGFGKTVISNCTTGGSADGGIDGIMETVDSLGFRETVMVQTKNRSEPINETVARGFYGAVCAKQGSRGILVTSSEFHPAAREFLESIDNCVGVDSDKLFEMAIKTHYGIKKQNNTLTVDEKII